MVMRPDYPFGSCQYESAYDAFEQFTANWPTDQPKPTPRVGFTKEDVVKLLNAAADAAWDLWSAAPTIADFTVANWLDFDSIEPEGDGAQAGFACAVLSIAFGLEYSDFPEYST